jgi:hypothetical protein
MYNRNPNDVADERTDIPETYEQDRERPVEPQAELRRTTDSVSGTSPETEPIDPVTDMVNRREAEEER